MHRFVKRAALALIVGISAVAALAACDESKPSTSQAESKIRDSVYEYLAENYPINPADYSNDRKNIDFWVDTWATAENAEGKLAYVYLLDMEGDLVGYYITDGLPTAKCKMGTPPYDFEQGDLGDLKGDFLVPAPSLTGTYSTGSGECNIYYAKDALTGSYMEWMAGGGLNQLVYDQPLPLPEGVNPPALGFTEFDDVD